METIKCTRPNGYNGNRIEVELYLDGNRIMERHEHGSHNCPAVSSATNMAELKWLIDNHQNFKNYRRI